MGTYSHKGRRDRGRASQGKVTLTSRSWSTPVYCALIIAIVIPMTTVYQSGFVPLYLIDPQLTHMFLIHVIDCSESPDEV